jgi:hypothetical protein
VDQIVALDPRIFVITKMSSQHTMHKKASEAHKGSNGINGTVLLGF